jgi:hypothetical protein
MPDYGVQLRLWGTVKASQSEWPRASVVQFDKYPENPTLWFSGATEILPKIPRAKENDRVVLEYITTPSSGLWYGRLPRLNEKDPHA